MKKKDKSGLEGNKILSSSVELWSYLKKNAGLDSIFYDKEILEGSPTGNGIYYHLNIEKTQKNFDTALRNHSITVEQLLVALFKTLQPYSQMMNDLCVFFEHHLIKETNRSLEIRFDFDKTKDELLDFNLEHFKQTIEKYSKVNQLIFYYHLNSNQLWQLKELFSQDKYSDEDIQNQGARDWIDNYNNGNDSIFKSPNFENLLTGNSNLDQQLFKIIGIWKSFVNACINISPNRSVFRKELKNTMKSDDTRNKTLPWSPDELFYAESDFWPSSFLQLFFFRLEQLQQLNEDDKNIQQENLAQDIIQFLNNVSIVHQQENQILKELVELLKLPIWKKRYELYAAWILTVIDEIFSEYPHEIHHQNGKLLLTFSETHLATIKTEKGDMLLLSEVRSPVDKPEGISRKSNIQPDYSIYLHNSKPENCIVVIEVKQYRKSSSSNFKAALNDYTKGLPIAQVFLVNYGTVASKMNLATPERSHFYGQIKPSSSQVEIFKEKVKSFLPRPTPNGPKEFSMDDLNLPIDHLLVDISNSLNIKEYKDFLKKVINAILSRVKIYHLVAVDVTIRKEWFDPSASNIQELLSLSFNEGTRFTHLIPDHGNVMILTDDDGVKDMESAGTSAKVIHYVTESEQKFLIFNNGKWKLLNDELMKQLIRKVKN